MNNVQYKLPTVLIVPIYGQCFKLKKKSYSLDDGISLELFPEHKVHYIFDRVRSMLGAVDSHLMYESRAFLYQKFSKSVIALDMKEYSDILEERRLSITRMIRSFFFTKFINLSVKPIIFFFGDIDKPDSYYEIGDLDRPRIPGVTGEQIIDNDLNLSIKIYNLMKKLSKINKKGKLSKLAHSISFFWLGLTMYNIDLAFVSFITSLEALMTTSITELTHKLAERTAFYIGSNKDIKKDLYEILCENYYRWKLETGVSKVKKFELPIIIGKQIGEIYLVIHKFNNIIKLKFYQKKKEISELMGKR